MLGPVELEQKQTRELLLLVRRACNAFVHGQTSAMSVALFKALAILSPRDRLCSICLSHHAEDIQHACE